MLIGIGLFMLVGFVVLVSALITDNDRTSLQNELNNLTQYLNDNNYGWLIDYNLSYSSIGVYRENSNEAIAVFENILEENWYKIYLTNLGENESYSTFDLKTSCGEAVSCYDNETKILTENGWKYFSDLGDNERVMTLNSETGEKEWQTPVEKQIYNNDNGEMYKVELVDGSELLVSEEHKVYAESKDSLKSFVLNTLTEDCSLNNCSLDQIAQLNFNASANIGTSFLWINCSAFVSNSLNDSFGNILIKLNKSESTSLNCSEFILAYFNTSDSFLFNSSIAYSGVNNSNLRKSELMIMNLTGFSLKNDINMFVSTTSCIIYHPSFLYLFHMPFFTLSPNLKQSSSVNSEFSSILSSFLSNNSLLTLSAMNFLTNTDQFVSGNCSISFFNSSGIDKVKLGILKSPLNSVYVVKDVELFKSFGEEDLSNFKLQKITDVYKDINENNKNVYFLNSENKPIKVKSITKQAYNGKIYDVDVENDIVLVRRNKLECQTDEQTNLIELNLNNDNNINNQNNLEGNELNSNLENGLEVESKCKVVEGKAIWSGNSNNASRSCGVEYDYVVDPSLTFMSGTILVTLNSPVNNSNFNVSSVTFNVTGNDTLSWCGVSINNQANVTMGNTSATAFNWTNSSISDGSYNFIITCNDSTGTFGNSGLNYFLIDTVIPTLNVTSPVNSSTYSNSSVLFNVSSSELGTGSIIPDIDNSLVSWWRMDDTNGSANSVTDYMGRNNGTAINAVQTSAGKLGKGFSFDGVLAWLGFNLKKTCSSDMSYIDKLGGYCIDKYEASTPGCEVVGNNCANYTHADYCPTICIPTAGVLGGVNSVTGTTALAYSKENVAPLVGVSQKQARQMCANAGKYLCTSQEWLGAANIKGQVYNLPSNLKDAPYRCVTDSTTYCNYAANLNKACNTTLWSGGKSNCTSSEGVYDMVGNVWEWTNESVDVINPGFGVNIFYYINTTDLSWSNSTTADSGKYGKDGTYFPANSTSVRAVIRGGFWNFGADAGPFCALLYTAPSDVYIILGFRCCSGQG